MTNGLLLPGAPQGEARQECVSGMWSTTVDPCENKSKLTLTELQRFYRIKSDSIIALVSPVDAAHL